MGLKFRKFIGFFERILHPAYGTCSRCKRPWSDAKEHVVEYDNAVSDEYLLVEGESFSVYLSGSGCFALCTQCWNECSVEERIKYYNDLVDRWSIYDATDDGTPWHITRMKIINAVIRDSKEKNNV